MDTENVEIIFNPKSSDVMEFQKALDDAGFSYSVREFQVQHYDAAGGFHDATIIAFGIATISAVKNIIIAFINKKNPPIELKYKGSSIKVANVSQLDAAYEKYEKMRSTETNTSIKAEIEKPKRH